MKVEIGYASFAEAGGSTIEIELSAAGGPIASRITESRVLYEGAFRTNPEDPTSFALSDHLSLDLGYRFFGSSRPEFKEANGLKFKMDYFSHSAVAGLRWGF